MFKASTFRTITRILIPKKRKFMMKNEHFYHKSSSIFYKIDPCSNSIEEVLWFVSAQIFLFTQRKKKRNGKIYILWNLWPFDEKRSWFLKKRKGEKSKCHFLQTWHRIFVTMEVMIKGVNSVILNVASPSWTRVSDCYLSFIYHPSSVVGNRCRVRLSMNYVPLFLPTLFLPTCRRKFCLYTVFVSFMYGDLYLGFPNIYLFSIDWANKHAPAACTKLGVMTHLTKTLILLQKCISMGGSSLRESTWKS